MEVSKTTSSFGDQTTLTLATMASEQEDAMMEAVAQLQAGLFWLPHPKKVLIYMKRLNDLPMTVDVLAETDIYRTVNSLCKYEEVGAIARNLVRRWKNLIPIDEVSDSDSVLDWGEQYPERSSSRKRPHDISSKEGDFQKTWKCLYNQSQSPDFRDKKQLKLWLPERSLSVSLDHERREEREQRNKILSLDRPGSGRVQSQPSTSLQQVNVGYSSHQEQRDLKFGKRLGLHIQDKVTAVQEILSELSQVKPRPFNEKTEHRVLYQKEKYQVDFEEQKKNFALSKEKFSNVPSREVCQRPPYRTNTKEKRKGATRRYKYKESCRVKKHFPSFIKHIAKTKHLDTPESKVEKLQLNRNLLDGGKRLKDKGMSSNVQTQEGKYKSPNSHKSTASYLLESGEPEPFNRDEQPTTSCGSLFTYAWQPQMKKNVKIPTVVHEDKGHIKENSARTDSKSPNSVQKLPEMNDGKPEKQPSGAMLAKVKNISTHVTPLLDNIILPTVPASHQIPSCGTSLPWKLKKRTSYHEEEGVGFIGRRINSKMQVYSGSKCDYQQKLISLHQQCIRVLNSHLDSIFDIGNVPYTVLEPVLEKCTPKQLQRIEEYNHLLIENTSQLWKIHCYRDFKKEIPDEVESWRELYFELQEIREQRLLLLTENIRLANASKPKGRQTMLAFVNSVVKPPWDVRKRQVKFGTGRVGVPKMIKIKPALATPTTHYSGSNVQPYAGPSTSGTKSKSSFGSMGSCGSRKTVANQPAPMMTKTVKAFKNRFFH